jgi:Uma2 family endonuclease
MENWRNSCPPPLTRLDWRKAAPGSGHPHHFFLRRRPDFAYYSPADAARIDLRSNRVLGVPTLVVEILSEDDEKRDLVTKRSEYARAGIQHYWIAGPQRHTVLTLVLRGNEYEVNGEFSGGEVLTSVLFPGLEIPLTRLFRSPAG